jgi:hypothetical protein
LFSNQVKQLKEVFQKFYAEWHNFSDKNANLLNSTNREQWVLKIFQNNER